MKKIKLPVIAWTLYSLSLVALFVMLFGHGEQANALYPGYWTSSTTSGGGTTTNGTTTSGTTTSSSGCGSGCGECEECQDGQCVKVKCDDPNNQGQATDGHPVVLRTGDDQHIKQDLFIPGRLLPVEIVRTYRTQSENNSTFGYGWDLNYNMRITKLPESHKLLLSNGRGNILKYNRISTDPNIYISPEGSFDKIVEYSDGTCILLEKYGKKLYFDSAGKLEAIQDRTGNNSITFTYDGQNRLQKISNDLGRDINFAYYSDRWTITDFNSRTWTYHISGAGDLQTVTDPNGLVTTYNYSSHNITSITDANNQTWFENSYDDDDRVEIQRYGNSGDIFQFTYYPDINQTKVTDRREVNTITVYNSAGLPLSEATYTFNPKLRPDDPDSYTTYYEYDSIMNLILQTMPGGNYVYYEYDDNGNITGMMMDPNDGSDPIIAGFTYNSQFNFVETATDARGNTTIYDYNSDNGNLESITYPEVEVIDANGALVRRNPVITFSYNIYGQIEKMNAPDGIITQYEYYNTSSSDPNYGRLKKIIADYNQTDGLNIATEYKYDILGNVIEVNDPNGDITKFAYNVLGRVAKITDAANNQTNFSYNKTKMLSRVERTIDGPDQVTQYYYDILDNVKEIIDPLGYTTELSRDKNENLSDVNDAERNNTHYEYDERNLLWKTTDANGGIAQFSYTLNGKLKDINDANGNITSYEYDGLDRLVKIIYPGDSNEQFTYDENGNLTSKTTRKGDTILYEYDALNRLITKDPPGSDPNIYFRFDIAGRVVDVNDGRTVANGGGITSYKYDHAGRVIEVNDIESRVVKYEYDRRGLRTKLTYPDDSNVTYEYDALMRLTKVKYNGSTVAEYSYDELSRRTLLKYGNDANIVYQYDVGNRLKRLTNNIGSEQIYFNYADYDKVGNRLSMKISDANKQVYEYDNLYQLTYVDYNDGNSTNYGYDKLGNRTIVVNGGTTVYDSNRLNQYISVGGINYSYDKNGNLTSDGIRTYSYDYENRLKTVTNPTGWYRYDYNGRRVRKIGGITEKYCYDGDRIIDDYNSAGIMQKKYVFGPGIDEPICMLDVKDDNAIYYYHYDGLGSIVALSGVSHYNAVSAGGYHNLALKTNGSIAGWGRDNYGQATPTAGNDYVAIAPGLFHSLALKGDGSVVGWGDDQCGQATPPEGNDFVAAAAGVNHSLALKSDGTIAGWGSNYYADCQDTYAGQATPPVGSDYVAIAAGAVYSLALKSNGSIVGWGWNDFGQATPPEGNDFVAIAAGYTHALALKDDGSLVGWGASDLGDGPITPPSGNDYVAIAAGHNFSLALKSDGSIVGWGQNDHGQATPPSGNNYVAITAGGSHSLALKSNGSIVAWGYNYYGQGEPPAQSIMIVERYSYDVFGKPTIKAPNGSTRTTSAFGNRYMFTGREYDYETGNYYYRARYYSPKIGRFLQPDAVRFGDGLNIYTYCYNNPIRYLDPYGLGFWSWAGNTALGAISGAASGAISGAIGGAIAGAAAGGLGAIPGALAGAMAGAGVGAIGGAISAGASDLCNQLGGGNGLSPGQAALAGGLGGIAGGAASGITAAGGSAAAAATGGAIGGAISSGTSAGIASNGNPAAIGIGAGLGLAGGAGSGVLSDAGQPFASGLLSADTGMAGDLIGQVANLCE